METVKLKGEYPVSKGTYSKGTFGYKYSIIYIMRIMDAA